MIVSNSINQMFEEMKAWRQELHSIPEIGLEEYETSKYIKSKLSEFNIEFKDGYANTGIVARVKGSQGESDKSIGLRADFDALPMPEKNEFKHKSKNDFYNQYLAYHEGQGGWKKESYLEKNWLMEVAKTVERNAKMYNNQLKGCEEKLNKKGFFGIF